MTLESLRKEYGSLAMWVGWAVMVFASLTVSEQKREAYRPPAKGAHSGSGARCFGLGPFGYLSNVYIWEYLDTDSSLEGPPREMWTQHRTYISIWHEQGLCWVAVALFGSVCLACLLDKWVRGPSGVPVSPWVIGGIAVLLPLSVALYVGNARPNHHYFDPIGCHPGCFPAGTPIDTPRGPVPVESLWPGGTLTAVGPGGAWARAPWRTCSRRAPSCCVSRPTRVCSARRRSSRCNWPAGRCAPRES